MLTETKGTIKLNNTSAAVYGYEIHAGYSTGPALNKPLLTFTQHPNDVKCDGFISDDNQIAGTYLHGLFDNAQASQLIIDWVLPSNHINQHIDIEIHREQQLTRLANMCREHLDISQIIKIYQNG